MSAFISSIRTNVEELQQADIIIVPGSKSTLSDLYELRRNGVAQAIIRAHRAGKTILGICGGYQILGQEVYDPDGVEGDLTRLPGLGCSRSQRRWLPRR